MKKLSSQIINSFSSVDSAAEEKFRKAFRAAQVRAIWEKLVEETILKHTNAVYILNNENKKVMHVYVDESIYAAELNNRRELILMQCKRHYNEEIDELQIHISYGNMKNNYPYKTPVNTVDKNPAIALNPEELAAVEQACTNIENSSLKDHVKKAMIADLEWKKGNPQ